MNAADLLAWERQRITSVQATFGTLPLYASSSWFALAEDDPWLMIQTPLTPSSSAPP